MSSAPVWQIESGKKLGRKAISATTIVGKIERNRKLAMCGKDSVMFAM